MTKANRPTLFDANDASLKIKQQPQHAAGETDHQPPPTKRPPEARTSFLRRLSAPSFWLISSIIGLLTLWGTSELLSAIETLIRQNNPLGKLALAFAVIAGTALFIIIIREINSLWGLKNLAHLKTAAEQTYAENKLKPAKNYLRDIIALYEGLPNRAWMLKTITPLKTEIMDGRELIEMIDQEIGKPLDDEAKKIITSSAKKVSLITAIAPGPLLDMAAVALINLTMIRKIAATYGIKPGLWGQVRLCRSILAHLALSGGIALTSDLLQPLIGSSIAAKLSKKLGEGLFNGALTIRIGLSAIELTRPIPHKATKPPSFKELALQSFNRAKDS